MSDDFNNFIGIGIESRIGSKKMTFITNDISKILCLYIGAVIKLVIRTNSNDIQINKKFINSFIGVAGYSF